MSAGAIHSNMPGVVNFGKDPFSVELREVPVPEIGAADILLRVGAVSVCGSDVHQWRGSHSWPVNYPCILGHEFSGTVAAVGADVKGFREGDRVVSETAAIIDETSPLCRGGLYNLDPTRRGFGYGVDGAMTEYVRVPARCLHRIPDQLPFERAALTEPCCVAYNAVCVNGRVRPGDTVLVIGPGPIGLLCAHMAKLSGAGHVIVAGLPSDQFRFSVARSLGADKTLDSGVVDYVCGWGDGLGVDVAIDASGASVALQMALQAVRPAGQIIKVGWGPQPLQFSLDPLVQKNVTISGSFSHNWPVWERVISMIVSGQINLEPVVSRVAGLSDWHECFEKMEGGEYVKAVLTP
jgi:L-iditol 2-dehydrogenase